MMNIKYHFIIHHDIFKKKDTYILKLFIIIYKNKYNVTKNKTKT